MRNSNKKARAHDLVGESWNELAALGQRALNTVGLPLIRIDDPDRLFAFGALVHFHVRRASDIANPPKEPTKAQAVREANNVAAKLVKAIQAIQEFNSLWEGGCPAALTMPDHWSHATLIAEMEIGVRHFRDEISDEFDSWQPNAADAAWEAAWDALEEKPEDHSQFNPEGIEDVFLIDSIKLFVGFTLADFYRYEFGRRPYPSEDKDRKPAGPFLRFARFVLNEAGVKLADATVNDYLDQAQKAGRRMQGGKAAKK